MADFDLRHGRCWGTSPAPKAWVRTVFGKPVAVSMKWHHVIPRSALTDAWNALARHAKLAPARNALHTYMRLLGISHIEAKHLLQAMEAATITFDQSERLETALGYPPWDIVEGPGKRSDDPKDTLDEYTIGLSPAEANRHARLKGLYPAFGNFNRAASGVDAPSTEAFKALDNPMRQIERTLVDVKDYIPFRESMWEVSPGAGNQALIPAAAEWRKRLRAMTGKQAG